MNPINWFSRSNFSLFSFPEISSSWDKITEIVSEKIWGNDFLEIDISAAFPRTISSLDLKSDLSTNLFKHHRSLPERLKVSSDKVPSQEIRSTLARQFSIQGNGFGRETNAPRYIGHCFYGAIATAIFNRPPNPSDQKEIKKTLQLAKSLRKEVANYLRDHWEKFDFQLQDAFQEKHGREAESLHSFALEIASEIENSNRWATALDIAIVSELLSTRIDVYNLDQVFSWLSVGGPGMDEGAMLPNLMFGEHFQGPPLVLKLQGADFSWILRNTI